MLKSTERRIAICYFLFFAAMFAVALRIISLIVSPALSAEVNSTAMRTVTVSHQRGTIFDCNMEPITNRNEKYMSVFTDIQKADDTLKRYFSEQETADIISSVKEASLPMITTEKFIAGEGIVSFKYYEHPEDTARHLIGYTDQEGHGISGLEAVLDEYLYTDNKSELTFGIDGHGRLIQGDGINYETDTKIEESGVMLTLDYDIQKICEEAAEELLSGAVVVSEVSTGEIKAMVSRPDFELSGLAEALTDDSSPLLNRAMQTYNVGSGFKPLVAAAAIESGMESYICFCGGYADIDGQRFRCHKISGHDWLTLSGALKFSCNAYFYNLAVTVGAEKIYTLAEQAGFNNSVSFGHRVATKKAQIGDKDWLMKSDRALANLAIGQGELMVSPVGILQMYSAIASNGSYTPLSLFKGFVENGELCEGEPQNQSVKIMSEYTARSLREGLLGVLDEDGTGAAAKPKTVTAAGKTSTAETGIIKDEKRVVNSWFCGFFPFDEPKYAVSVLAENSAEGCGGVFAEIADKVTALKKD